MSLSVLRVRPDKDEGYGPGAEDHPFRDFLSRSFNPVPLGQQLAPSGEYKLHSVPSPSHHDAEISYPWVLIRGEIGNCPMIPYEKVSCEIISSF